MREKPVLLGEQVTLVGILCEPGGQEPAAKRPACILVNAGLVHRVGPNRLYVQIARRLASNGYPALRFDLSGRGDSEVRRDGMSFLASSLAEIRTAMDFLQKSVGADRFILIGICSGAINSLQAAVADPQVVGVVAIDSPAYPTFGYHLRHYARRLLNPGSWLNTLKGQNALGRRLWRRTPPPSRDPNEFINLYGDAVMPPKSETAAVLQRAVDRGARLMFVFSGSWAMYTYRNQFRDAFPDLMKRGGIRVDYVPDADHTFTQRCNQQRLLAMIGEWLADSFERDDRSAVAAHPTHGAAAR